MYDDLLKLAKQSLSIVDTSTAKDEEILNSIKSAVQDLSSLGIRVKENHQQIYNAIVLFVKSQFSTVPVNEKKRALETYRIIAGELAYSNETRARETDKPNLLFDSNFYTFRNGKEFENYYTNSYVDEFGTVILPTFDGLTNYMTSKGVTSFKGGSAEARRLQLLEEFPGIKKLEFENNKWYARNNTTTNTKIEYINVENSLSKTGLRMKNNQLVQNIFTSDIASKYSLSYKLKKENGQGIVRVRVRNLSKGQQILDFTNDQRIVQGRDNGIISVNQSANDSFSGNSGSNNMTSFWTKVVHSKRAKTILIPAGTYTIKGNVWKSGNNKPLEFSYYAESDLETRKTFSWQVGNGTFTKVHTFTEPVYFDSIAWLALDRTAPFSYLIENLRFEIGDTSSIPSISTLIYKEFSNNVSVEELTEFKFENITFKEGINQIEILTEYNSEAEITDIMLVKSPTAEPWSLASFN